MWNNVSELKLICHYAVLAATGEVIFQRRSYINVLVCYVIWWLELSFSIDIAFCIWFYVQIS